MTQKNLTYSDVGVDVGIEAKAARILYHAAQKTWENRKGMLGEIEVKQDSFSGRRFFRVDSLPVGTISNGNSDGLGLKPEIAIMAKRFDTLAFDLMAMICDDAAIQGGEPVAVQTVLVVNTLGKNEARLRYIRELAKGYIKAAKEACVVVINGEIAQHPSLVDKKKFSLDWNGSVVWYAHESRLIDGRNIRPGDLLVGLKEKGPRCNGTSLLLKSLEKLHGENWSNKSYNRKRLVDLALRPSKIYTPAI